MFSVEASSGSARSTLRNSRRRPRNSDGAQQPRRKRSKMGDDTFVAAADSKMNGNGSMAMNGHAVESIESSLVLVDMPVREKKTQLKRALKEDTALYLNKNENYSVKKLPSFPSSLASGSIPFQASALSSANLALAITASQALVWDYSVTAGTAKVLALPLPPTLKGSDPLPFGAVVRNGPANDFGVVAVAPATGKIVFWENIDSADARGHFPQRHQGVEGSIKLSSGERITKLVDIEYAGYIAILSSGRLAQITLRDSQGRPSVTATFMSDPSGSSSSYLGFRGFFSGSSRKTVASVQARPSESKGQMEVITATRNGTFQLWDLSWSGQQIFKRELDAHADIVAAIQQGTPPEIRGTQTVHILDFNIIQQSQTAEADLSLLALIALTGNQTIDYFLLELDVSENASTVSRAIPLKNFRQPDTPKEPTGTLLLPAPGHTAFVQLPTGVVVASLAVPEESPEAQLFADSGSSLLPFQDTIYFRKDANVNVVGHAQEHVGRKDKHASVLFFVADYGILQVDARPPPKSEENSRRKVTAYSKICQATFFATTPGTILDFSTKSRYDFAVADVEKAALRVSNGILSSSYEHFNRATSSMEDLLRKRSFALENLITHVQSEYPPISFTKRWELLWQAEKLSASIKLWKWYQGKLREHELHPEAFSEEVLMNDIVQALNEKFKSPVDKEEPDRVRQFFIKNVENLGILVPWGWNYLRMFYLGGGKNRSAVMQRLSEANDVLLTVLEAGYSFRQLNCEKYGLDPNSLEDGVLKAHSGYDRLPPIWTSSHNIVSSLRSIIDVGRNLGEDSFEQRVEEELAQKIAKDNPRLVRMGCQTHIERFQWALDQSDEKTREMGLTLRSEWDTKVRPEHIYGLMSIGLATDGMNLAERYQDMPTLVRLIWDETTYLEVSKLESESKLEEAEINVKLNRIKDRVSRYFTEYGKAFAEAYYEKRIAENQAGRLFGPETAENQKLLTKFLSSDPSRAKLHWINMIGHKDFDSAGVALYKVARNNETNAWSKRVELSLSKLALMCKDQTEPASAEHQLFPAETETRPRDEKTIKKVEIVNASARNLLEVSKVQDMVYDGLRPTITGAVDDEGAIELLMAELGQGRLQERPALQSLLKQGFDELIHHRAIDPALLIDVLTLMTPEGDDADVSDAFVLALRALALAWDATQRTTRVGLKGLIWKRLMIQDDWARINTFKGISQTSLNEFLVTTNLAQVLRELLILTRSNKQFNVVWFNSLDEVSGKGCTDGELCIRFPSEDLRQPIMQENALDETLFNEYIQNARLQRWFGAAFQAAKWSLDGGEYDGAEAAASILQEDREDAGEQGATVVRETVESVEEVVKVEASEGGGDGESGDVEMADG
ncbi:unnamed protein product [Periconia digitata]|uniref:Uncharacterized protein n=1 Tax=Periconia digitata TaxID=1303443 RepID=A0A9W4UMK8_9PLEO|nr:unnamed protein product [Periconia digitata]